MRYIMNAAIVQEYGGPEVLKYGQFPDPVQGAGEVLVRVAATSINPFDIMRRSGVAAAVAPINFPGIVGVDLAGTVEAVGKDVDGFAVGDRVFAMADRTYAELCVVRASSLAKIPVGIDLVEAAALPLVTTTGNMLITVGTGTKAGQTVLVTGAAGNVGRSAVFTARSLGATVIAGVLKSQLEAAATLGADSVIATDDKEAMTKLPMLDAVADTVAGKTAEALIAKVKAGGVFASVLGAPANAGKFPDVRVVPVYAAPDPKILLFMADAVKAGKLVIPIGQKLPLADADKAQATVAQGLAHGKVLLVIAADAGTEKAEEQVKVLLAAYNSALNDSKTDAVMPLYMADGIFMPPFSQSAIGQAAIRKAYDAVFETRKFEVKFNLAELVVLSPKWAFGRTNSAGHTTNPKTGIQSSEGNQELFLFTKDTDGAWKIARYSFSPTNPPKQ
jgi:uncharacterized protein (TIGR02246 family)